MLSVRRWIALVLAAAAPAAGLGHAPDQAPNEILVKFKPATGRATEAALHANVGSRVLQMLPRVNVERVALGAQKSVADALAYYRSQPSVEFAEPNYTRQLSYAPSDPLYPSQWALAKMRSAQAWDVGKGSMGIIVAVIDSGIDLNHEDLRAKIAAGYDFSDNDSVPNYSNPHGVHTAGIVAANTDNGIGVAGSGFRCRVMPLKIFPNGLASTSAQAIIYAADHGARVISMSYGSYQYSQTERNATEYAWSKGVVLVAAAGNDSTASPTYPCSYPKVIGVGSTDEVDQRSVFSNFGADHVSVAAPGDDILSTYPGGYAALSGTSMACPQVAGLAGLLVSLAPAGTSNQQIRDAIESTTDPVGSWVEHGRINAFHAIEVFDPGPEVVSDPVDAQLFTGTSPSGSAAGLLDSDGLFFSMTSTAQTAGQVAAATITFAFAGAATNLRTSTLVLEANGPFAASNRVYLWNFVSSQWDPAQASALAPSGPNRVTLLLPRDLTPYVQVGQVKVLSRAQAPRRPNRGASGMPAPFLYKIGFAQIRTRPGA